MDRQQVEREKISQKSEPKSGRKVGPSANKKTPATM